MKVIPSVTASVSCEEIDAPHAPFRFRVGDIAALSVLFLAWLIFFIPMLFQEQSIFYRDILHFAYPMKHFIHSSLQSGNLPFWWPSIHGGVPFLPLLHPGALYPLNIFLLGDDFTWCFNFFFALHFLILATGCYFLGRAMGFSFYAGIACGLTALWGGFFISLSQLHNHFQSASWLPWILFFFVQFLQKGGRARFVSAIIVFVFQVLAGSPEFCLLTTALLFAYVTFLPGSQPLSGVLKSYAFIAMGTAFTLGLSALQLVPTQMAVPHTVRDGGLSFASATLWSLPFEGLGAFLVPMNLNGFMSDPAFRTDYFILSPYMGWFPMLVLALGLLVARSRIYYFWTGVFFVGIFFALGHFNPVYAWLYDWVPFLDWFRYPEKFLILSAFAAVFLAGYGVDTLSKWTRRHGNEVGWALAGFVVVALGHGAVDDLSPLAWQTLAGLMFALTLFALHERDLMSTCALKGGLTVLIALDLLLKNTALIPLIQNNFFNRPPAVFAQLAERKPLYRFYSGPLLAHGKIPTKNSFPKELTLLRGHLALKEQIYPNLATQYGLEFIDGITGWGLKDAEMWTAIFIASPPEKRRRMLERGNVRYWTTIEKKMPGSPDPVVEEMVKAVPRAVLVPKARYGGGYKLSNLYYSEGFDPEKEVLLSESYPPSTATDFVGKVHSVEYSPNAVRIQTEQNEPGYLVLFDSYFPGWSATVDGKSVPILRGNYFYRAVALPSGQHRVQMQYIPEGFSAGLFISLNAFFALCIALFNRDLRRIWRRN
ncbi:MAG: hypothetical protein COV66_08615 [Nitrospinae bacterium CG11_big_fil_rev_8_21_14_0_20_45_15]|nr:MAG: hypothetical protein COV66_08615 [Nitrospinae bacterium CG11_big_fil_rev_8_21_14_0_20_45_15]